MRPKRKSTILETGRQRLAGLKKISPKPDFGSSFTEAAYEQEITGFSEDQDSYNGDVAALDHKQNQLNIREQNLADWNQFKLAAVWPELGFNSGEYELVGGTRRSER